MNKYDLRPVTSEDDSLLKSIYGSTRSEELSRVPDWSEEMKNAFISHQFFAQKDYYSKVYPNADYYIILYENEDVGRLYVERNAIEGNIRIIDIAILPEFRNNGIGSYFLEMLKNEAQQNNKILSIHVEKFNRALSLYLRLGFQIIHETHGVYLLLHWQKIS